MNSALEAIVRNGQYIMPKAAKPSITGRPSPAPTFNRNGSHMEYYVEWNCPNCDETNYYGPNLTMIKHKGQPVVMLGEGEQTSLECEYCDTRVYTGELELLTEDDM
jgi:hypothetical protein